VTDFAALESVGNALDVPLWMLRLEKKTEILEAAGHATVASLFAGYRSDRLLNIPSVGRSTVDEIGRRFALLEDVAAEAAGGIDWERYALALGHDLVPASDVASGRRFLAAFAEVVDAVIRSHPNPVDQLILTERLVRQGEERLTLEQIAQRAMPPITRERVRQLEKRLIGALSDALLLDDYRELPFHFRTSFAVRWKDAAQRFSNDTEISFGAFMAGLEEVWEVPFGELLPHLPLITSILTSRATLPPQLRQAMRLHPRLYGEVDQRLSERPIGWLALGKTGVELCERGITTIGDLIIAGRQNTLPATGTRAGTDCRRALNALAVALGESGTVDWQSFGKELGLKAVPAVERERADDFLHNLNADLEEAVRVTGSSGRAAGIFRLRTCRPRTERPTLERTAQALGGHAPTIKREETDLLNALHAQLVDGDFLHSRILYPPHFLARWRSARQAFERSSADYQRFCSLLADEWHVPASLVLTHGEGLWAVLTRYPSGRRTVSGRKRSVPLPVTFTGGTILLRGFRRAH
jgi:hypothetical protein